MGKSTGRRLKVWSWDGRDVVSLHDLEFVTAVYAKSDLQGHSARLRLPKPDFGSYVLVKPTDPRFDVAMAAPERVLFRDLDGDAEWRDEDELASVRATSTAKGWHQGKGTTPLHRP